MKRPPLVRVRGIRQVVPTGHVIGRVSPGAGDPELIPLAWLAAKAVGTGVVGGGGAKVAELGWTLPGLFDNGVTFRSAISGAAITYPSAFETSYAACSVAPLLPQTIYIVNDLAAYQASGAPTGCIAHVDFATASTTGTVTWYSATVQIAGHTPLYAAMPAVGDPFFAGVSILLAGDTPGV